MYRSYGAELHECEFVQYCSLQQSLGTVMLQFFGTVAMNSTGHAHTHPFLLSSCITSQKLCQYLVCTMHC